MIRLLNREKKGIAGGWWGYRKRVAGAWTGRKNIFVFSLFFLLVVCVPEKKFRITIQKQELFVELAITREQREKGLMKRKHLPENEGMLFVFPEPDYQSFWMKDTWIPLDLAFFDEEGFLIEVRSMEPHTTDIYISSQPAKYALETNRGWFSKRGIKKFARLELSEEIHKEIRKYSGLKK